MKRAQIWFLVSGAFLLEGESTPFPCNVRVASGGRGTLILDKTSCPVVVNNVDRMTAPAATCCFGIRTEIT